MTTVKQMRGADGVLAQDAEGVLPESDDTGPPSSSRRSDTPWRPPIALWHLYLLILLTSGVYIFFWTARVAGDMRRHVNDEIRPWHYVAGLLIPIAGLFVVHKQASQIRQLNDRVDQRIGPPPWVIVILTLVVTVLPEMAEKLLDQEVWYLETATFLLFVALIAIPWLLMQRQLNCFKLALSGARWSGRPFHFSKLQYLALSPGVVAVGLFAFVSHENLLREWGDHLGPGETVSGTSGLYVLSPPDDGWVRVKPGTIEEETDLELYGSSTETWVVAYVNCGAGMGMDYLVEFRQNQIQAEVDDFSVSEERLIMPGKLLPVSYAHYSGKLPVTAEKQTWWVATIVTDDASIEVIAGVAHPVPWTQVCLTRRA